MEGLYALSEHERSDSSGMFRLLKHGLVSFKFEKNSRLRKYEKATELYRNDILTGELMALLRLQASANQRSLALTIFDVCMHGRWGNDLASLQAHLSYRVYYTNHR